MKPYGLKRRDCSQRPHCPCCTTKYHGMWEKPRAVRLGGRKRARQAGLKLIKEQMD